MSGAAVHESLSDDGQTGINDVRLVDVEHKLWVLDDIYPVPEWQTVPDNKLEIVHGQTIKLP